MKTASDHIISLIEEEILKLPHGLQDSKNIFIGGFSQGGMLSLCSFLRFDKPLGGVICLSGINTYDSESDNG